MPIYRPELLASPVPRYTSYPTAAEFHAGVGPADMSTALARVAPDASLSLYLHIPFCHAVCWYCGCNTGTTGQGGRLAAYLQRLTAEITLVAAELAGRGRVTHIAFGGGSPNAVAPADFNALLDSVRRNFAADDAIISVEIDPRNLDATWATMLGETGVTRASLGVQTLDPKVQAAIGRAQPLPVIENAVRLLRDAGIDSLNFDLMYGLPGQSLDSLSDTLSRCIKLSPDRFAVFGYAHVPHIVARQRQIATTALPDAATRFHMAGLAHRMLTGGQYNAIGFDHFARPGDALAVAARSGRLRRTFQGFTDDDALFTIGMGISAISVFPDSVIQNEKHGGRYQTAIDNGNLPAARGCRLTADDEFRASLIEGILGNGQVDTGRLSRDPTIRDRLAPFEAAGLMTWQGSWVELAPGAMPYARSIAAAFDRYRETSTAQFSHAV